MSYSILIKLRVLKLFAFFISIFPLTAQIFENKSVHFAIEPFVSYTNGHLGEFLFHSSSNDERKKVSYLEWDKNLFLFGASFYINYKNFYVETKFSSSIFDQNSGKMQDSDWKNTSDSTMKTTYSVGDNKSIENYSARLSISYDFSAVPWLSFSPVAEFQYDFDSFERSDAEGWYSSDNRHWWYDETSTHYPKTYWNDEKGRYVTLKLAGIDFYRHFFSASLGIGTKIKPISRLSIDFRILVSPFSYFYSVDSHHAQDKTTKAMYKKHYREIQFSYFNIFSLSAGANFKINKLSELTFHGSYTFNFEIARGTTFADYFQDTKQDDYVNLGQDSGASIENLTLSFGLKTKIW